MESSPLECDACKTSFSTKRLPRNLPCAHTFCGPCIDGIIATRKKTCPNCRREFTAASAEELMINRSLLDVIKTLGSKGIKRSFRGFPKELEVMKNVSADIEILSEMRASVIDINKTIEGSVAKLQQIKLSIQYILDSVNKDMCLKNKMILILQQEGKTQGAKVEAAIASTSKQKDDILKDVFKMKRKLKNVAEEIEKETRVAVKVIEGKQMVAPVGVKPTKQVCWSPLEEGNLLSEGLSIKHEALMNRSSRRAFLDLAVEGRLVGRIIIKVMDEGNLALNFLHLCAGDLGPSLADSHLSRVVWKGQAGERIRVDGYKTSGGNTTTAIIKQIDWNKEEQREIYKETPYKAGEVRGHFLNELASQFYIVTRDDPNMSCNYCFGIVEEGLGALRDAILQYPDIEAVRIVDCGLMFPS